MRLPRHNIAGIGQQRRARGPAKSLRGGGTNGVIALYLPRKFAEN